MLDNLKRSELRKICKGFNIVYSSSSNRVIRTIIEKILKTIITENIKIETLFKEKSNDKISLFKI